jgi:hypothetical protein
MNWRGVDTWVVLALGVWLAVSLSVGLALGLVHPQPGESWLVSAVAGVLVPVAAFVGYMMYITVVLAVAVLVWVTLARAFGGLEASRRRLAVVLGLYSLLAAALVWWLFPLDRALAPAGAALTAISIWAPRFISATLAAGAFRRQ